MSDTTDPTPSPAESTPAPAPSSGGDSVPSSDASPTPQSATPPADSVSNDAEAMRSAYNFDLPAEDQPPADPPAEDKPAYAVEFPEGFAVDEAFNGIVTPIAASSGLDGKAFGALTAKVIGAIQDAEYANMVKSDAELKSDWGAEYNANMLAAKTAAHKLKQATGLTDKDLAPLQSPKGMRLLFAISQLTGESSAAGVSPASASESSWARDVISDPNHPDYHDFRDPSSPRWRELNARYNRIAQGSN